MEILNLIPWEAWAGLLGLVTAFFGVRSVKKSGRTELAKEIAEDRLKRNKEADDAAVKERKETSGLSDGDVADRVHGRDSDWNRL